MADKVTSKRLTDLFAYSVKLCLEGLSHEYHP